jgi:3-oxoacyl-[acyl-carrier protein] reductase
VRFANKIVIITGAGRGIGQAAATRFAREGAKVAVCDRDKSAVDETVAMIQAEGAEALEFAVDVTDSGAVEGMVADVIAGWHRIDVLVNNAGAVMDAQLKDMSDEQFDRIIDINLKGTYRCARAAVGHMIKQGSGVIINASSIAGVYGNFGQTNYAAAKAGVIGMTKTWARELGRKGIRVNAVCPGLIETPLTADLPEKVMEVMRARIPLGRAGRPEEIAGVYAFLASDDASYINGAVIEVSGGMSL